MGFSRSGIQAESVEMGEEEVDVLVCGMRGRGVDEHDGCEGVRRRLEEIRVCSLESHHPGILPKDTSNVGGELSN